MSSKGDCVGLAGRRMATCLLWQIMGSWGGLGPPMKVPRQVHGLRSLASVCLQKGCSDFPGCVSLGKGGRKCK